MYVGVYTYIYISYIKICMYYVHDIYNIYVYILLFICAKCTLCIWVKYIMYLYGVFGFRSLPLWVHTLFVHLDNINIYIHGQYDLRCTYISWVFQWCVFGHCFSLWAIRYICIYIYILI